MPIRSVELRKDWPWVKPLIEAVIAKTDEKWWPEDIYAAVKNQTAAMFVSDDPEGVLVAYQGQEAWTGDTVLHIWVCHCKQGMEMLWDEGWQMVEKMKERIGAKYVVMDSPRPGWQKLGWEITRYIYKR